MYEQDPHQTIKKKKMKKKMKTHDADIPPDSGYFELINKSSTFCCVKVLLAGGHKKFEIPRPSYFAIPPGDAVSSYS